MISDQNREFDVKLTSELLLRLTLNFLNGKYPTECLFVVNVAYLPLY